ncbi:hypothetical protein D3C75_992060 [compost metagenome]
MHPLRIEKVITGDITDHSLIQTGINDLVGSKPAKLYHVAVFVHITDAHQGHIGLARPIQGFLDGAVLHKRLFQRPVFDICRGIQRLAATTKLLRQTAADVISIYSVTRAMRSPNATDKFTAFWCHAAHMVGNRGHVTPLANRQHHIIFQGHGQITGNQCCYLTPLFFLILMIQRD